MRQDLWFKNGGHQKLPLHQKEILWWAASEDSCPHIFYSRCSLPGLLLKRSCSGKQERSSSRLRDFAYIRYTAWNIPVYGSFSGIRWHSSRTRYREPRWSSLKGRQLQKERFVRILSAAGGMPDYPGAAPWCSFRWGRSPPAEGFLQTGSHRRPGWRPVKVFPGAVRPFREEQPALRPDDDLFSMLYGSLIAASGLDGAAFPVFFNSSRNSNSLYFSAIS